MAKNTNPERVEILARKDKILETDLLKRYEDAKTEHEKYDLKCEWKKRHPLKNFNNHLAAYKKTVESPLAQPSELKVKIVTETRLGVEGLRAEVESFYSKKQNIMIVLERLKDEGLFTEDLLGGDNQDEVIMLVFEHNPGMGRELIGKINSGDPVEKAAAREVLVNIKKYLDGYEQTTEAAAKNVEDFKEVLVGDTVKDTLGNILEYAREKPLTTLASTAFLTGALYLIYKNGGDTVKSIMKWTGIGTLAVGGAWGLNNLVGASRDDGKTLWDLATFSLDWRKFDKVNESFREDLQEKTGDNRNAFEAMMHMGQVKGSSIANVFERALRDGEQKIDPKDLFAQGEAEAFRVKQISPEGMYEGIEGLMKIIAEKKLKIDPNGKDAVKKGLKYFKEHYGDQKLVYITSELYADHTVTRKRNEDGSLDMSDPKNQDDMTKIEGLSESEEVQETSIRKLFKKFDVDTHVRQRAGGIVLINGYPYEYSYDSEKKTHEFKDVIGDKKVIKVDEATDAKSALSSITAHSNSTMKEKFASQIGGANIEFDEDQGEWVNTRNLNQVPGMGFSDLEVEIVVKAGETAHLTMYREGSDQPYTDFAALTKDAANDLIEERIQEDLDYLIGNTAFSVESIRGSGDHGTFEIKYLGQIGKVTYKNGRIESVNLPNVEAMKPERMAAAGRTFEERMSVLSVNGKNANKVFEDLENMFDHQELGIGGAASDLANRIGQRWNEKAPLFYDRESAWKETVKAKREEIKTMMIAKIMVLMESNPDKATFDSKVKDLFDELAVELSHLEDEADQVSHSEISGGNYDEAIRRASEKMEELKYESAKYKGFMDKVESEMTNEKLDYVGNDGMAYARGIRSTMRQLVFEYTMPIPGMKDAQIGQVEERYLAVVLAELPNILKDALRAKDGNFDYLITEDQRIDRTGFEKAFKARIKKTYVEFKADKDNTFGSSSVTGRADNGAESLTGRIEGATELVSKEEDFAIEKLNEAFAPIEALESNLFTSHFEAMIGMRKEQISREIAQIAQSSTTPEQARVGMEKTLNKARREVMEYKTYVPRANTNSLPVLKEATQKILANMIDKPNWKEPARKLYNWLNGNFEFEHTYLIDNPEQLTFILGVFLEKCAYGRHDVSAAKADAYTDYFIFELDKILPDDANISVDNVSGTTRQMSDKEWKEAVTKMQAIKDYKDYYPSDAKPDVRANDLDAAVEARIKMEKEKSSKDFMKWFEKEMDPAEWFGLEGEWPDIYRTEVQNRLTRLESKYKTNEEYQKALLEYARYVRVERRFYKMFIKADISPDQADMRANVIKTIEKEFKNNFDAGKTALDYNKALEDAFKNDIRLQQIIDTLTIQIGPAYLPGFDLIQFTP